MNKSLTFLLAAAALSLTSCSDDSDNEKYRSEPPTLSDISVKPLSGNGTQIRVGERFVATAEQSKKGRLLNSTSYSWSCSSDNLSHLYLRSVIYDNENQNPTDTLVATAAGTYTLTFTGTYNASGNTQIWAQKYGSTFTEDFASGDGKVTYTTGGLLRFTVTATKTFKVEQ